mmetsp:Transcript_13645/g.20774  ORF Transcript_13645/g.20774 Transcript_13645/m.20774 type:complete len:300 (+) Transcript_13645:162-1061(+)
MKTKTLLSSASKANSDQSKQSFESLDDHSRKQEVASDSVDLLATVIDTISRITNDNKDLSDSATTIPQAILCGGSLGHQINDDVFPKTKKFGWFEDGAERREDTEEMWESDDEFSMASDLVPLSMMDEDALDEISFTRELMGYEEGFDDYKMPIGNIDDDQYEKMLKSLLESDSSKGQSSRIKLLGKSPEQESRPPRPDNRRPSSRKPKSRRPTSRKLNNTFKLKNVAAPSCREGPASVSKDGSCCSTSKSTTSSFSLRKKMRMHKPSDRSSNGSTEETSWWKFQRISPAREISNKIEV